MSILRRLNACMQEIRFAPQPRIAVEAMLIGLCRPSESGDAEGTALPASPVDAARITRLEEEVRRLTERLAAGGIPNEGTAVTAAASTAAQEPLPQSAVPKPTRTAAAEPSVQKSSASAPAANAPRQLDAALWKTFQTRLKERNKLAASLLSGAGYEGTTETHFFIRPATEMARDYIVTRHRAVFEEVLSELAGRPLIVVCTGGEEESAPSPPAAKESEYPAPVTELLRIAGEGARVEEVAATAKRPAPKPVTPATTAEEDEPYEVYEPTADEEAEMFDYDELPPDENT